MRLLIDANLSPKIAKLLTDAGHAATHVTEHGLLNATDEEISRFARLNDITIISADSDFAQLLAYNGFNTPSLILLRSVDHLTPTQQGDLLIANLPEIEQSLTGGAIASLTPRSLRVRALPLRARPKTIQDQ